VASSYPGSLDSFSTSHTTGQTIAASTDNDHASAINAIEAELGTTPSGSESTVAARFTAVESAATTHAADETAVHGISNANLLVGYNLFNGSTFPARPDFNVVLWVGGGSADDPTADMDDGDLWFPSEA
jgi:hypothetical protein